MNAENISPEKEAKVNPVVDHLNGLPANYHIHYKKLRGCHGMLRFYVNVDYFLRMMSVSFNTHSVLIYR